MEETRKNEPGRTARKGEKAQTGTLPERGAATQEDDSLPADVPRLCRVHVPDIRTPPARTRQTWKAWAASTPTSRCPQRTGL